ncbi:rRNA maturation RNase YbeY [Hyphomonas adhaerens]|uniref:rRNA maturation RNase YbeY n=1 Tax=Hyphomonas adhaerens TaxID=81029 RepID=UPI00235310E5|nr:rRNA maturation RNase YbeY [Hyphomonas adhaerens]|tara:strand:- start:486 stop:935 length:450 start_codon:yes stop_codon:yes gene_type:complete
MITTDLIIAETGWDALQDLAALCDRAFAAAAAVEPADGTVSLLLADDTVLHQLNRDFRGKDKPTDVLSFPAHEMDRPLLGDIAVALGVSARDADAQGIGLADHLTHLLVHGYLHLLGHDHEGEAEAALMEGLEIKALASLGIPNPYGTD